MKRLFLFFSLASLLLVPFSGLASAQDTEDSAYIRLYLSWDPGINLDHNLMFNVPKIDASCDPRGGNLPEDGCEDYFSTYGNPLADSFAGAGSATYIWTENQNYTSPSICFNNSPFSTQVFSTYLTVILYRDDLITSFYVIPLSQHIFDLYVFSYCFSLPDHTTGITADLNQLFDIVGFSPYEIAFSPDGPLTFRHTQVEHGSLMLQVDTTSLYDTSGNFTVEYAAFSVDPNQIPAGYEALEAVINPNPSDFPFGYTFMVFSAYPPAPSEETAPAVSIVTVYDRGRLTAVYFGQINANDPSQFLMYSYPSAPLPEDFPYFYPFDQLFTPYQHTLG